MTNSAVNTALVLREQPEVEVMRVITNLLDNVALLWQIPNWGVTNSVNLAEWILNNYSCEPLEIIIRCLKNPPVGADKIYRLTPDVVVQWMTTTLDKEAAAREAEVRKYKEQFTEKLPDVDYDSFRKRLAEGTALKDNKPKHWKDDSDYQKFKQERMLNHAKEDGEAKTEGQE